MFGQYYHQYDDALATSADAICGTRVQYAEELLRDVLNRAAILQAGPFAQASDCGCTGPEHVSRLESLRDAVEVFLDDCNEARIRARRSRMLSQVDGTGLLETGSNATENAEELERIGGALVGCSGDINH